MFFMKDQRRKYTYTLFIYNIYYKYTSELVSE